MFPSTKPLPNEATGNCTILPSEWYRDLSMLYSEPIRAYHTLEHISSLLTLLEQHSATIHDRESIEWAIWFHDAIYNPRETIPGGNEESSIQLLQQFIKNRPTATPVPSPDKLQKIIAMIRATVKHLPPSDLPPQQLEDLKLFLDFDLEVLSRPPMQYDLYAHQIRQEYAHYSESAYRAGRIRVLMMFLAREKIYFTGGEEWEKRERDARKNISREIEQLRMAQQEAGETPP